MVLVSPPVSKSEESPAVPLSDSTGRSSKLRIISETSRGGISFALPPEPSSSMSFSKLSKVISLGSTDDPNISSSVLLEVDWLPSTSPPEATADVDASEAAGVEPPSSIVSLLLVDSLPVDDSLRESPAVSELGTSSDCELDPFDPAAPCESALSPSVSPVPDPDCLLEVGLSLEDTLTADVLLTTEAILFAVLSTDALQPDSVAGFPRSLLPFVEAVLALPSCVLIIGPFTDWTAEVGSLDWPAEPSMNKQMSTYSLKAECGIEISSSLLVNSCR